MSKKIITSKKEDISDKNIKELATTLLTQRRNEKMDQVGMVMKLVGVGAFLGAAVIAPNLTQLAKPLIKDLTADEPWKRYNIKYLKRTLKRLEEQKMVRIYQESGKQVVELTTGGRRKVYKYALEEMAIRKPGSWSGNWWLVSYDIPEGMSHYRDGIRDYLLNLGFYKIQESVFIHAYPCEKEIIFLREYFGLGEYLRIFKVSQIENDAVFRDFFDV